MKTAHMFPLAFVALCAASHAQSMHWKLQKVSGKPNGRFDHEVASDEGRAQIVLFGGLGGMETRGDTWLWDGATWTEVKRKTSPLHRHTHKMVYDPVQKKVLLFGGLSGNYLYKLFTYLNDTWMWDGTNWKQAAPKNAPPVRAGHAMAYDGARKRVVMFGGWGRTSSLNDTWLWDGSDWKQARPVNSPPAGYRNVMAYDAARQRMVLFGGASLKTWLWDGTNWTQAKPINSPPESFGAMTFDAARARVVGFETSGSYLGNAWEWDGSNWVLVKPAIGSFPPSTQTTVYDSRRQRVLLFDLYPRRTTYTWGQTWTWGSVGVDAYGLGCGTPIVRLSSRSDARVGQPLLLESWNLSTTSTYGVLALGAKKVKLSLTAIGMPSCWLLQSNDVLVGAFAVSKGSGQFKLTIPNDKKLIGQKPLFQSIILDPTANRLGLLTSNGTEVTIR